MDFKDRLHQELSELELKVSSLASFIDTWKFSELDVVQMKLLRKQFAVMKEYRDILEIRVRLLN